MSPISPTAAVEQRLQRLEDSSTDFQAHAAAEQFRFEMISNQIKDLGDRMEKAVSTLSESVEGLKEQHAEQARKFDKLDSAVQGILESSEQREQDHERVEVLYQEHQKWRSRRKRVVAWGAIVGTAFLARFGESMWNWVVALFK